MRRGTNLWMPILLSAFSVAVLLSGCNSPDSGQHTWLSKIYTSPAEKMLLDLPKRETSSAQAKKAKDSIQQFHVDGVTSTSDWLTSTADGSIEATGAFLATGDLWKAETGKEYALLHFAVPQTVSNLTVYHILPLIVEDRGSLYSGTYQGSENLYKVAFTIQEGWLQLKSIDELGQISQDEDGRVWCSEFYPSIDSQGLYLDSRRSFSLGALWIDVRKDKKFTVGGPELGKYNPSLLGSDAHTGVVFPDKLGPAAFYHYMPIAYPDLSLVPPQGNSRQPTTSQVKYDGEKLIAVE